MADGEASRRRATRTTYGMSGEAAATLGARDPRPGACRPNRATSRAAAGWLACRATAQAGRWPPRWLAEDRRVRRAREQRPGREAGAQGPTSRLSWPLGRHGRASPGIGSRLADMEDGGDPGSCGGGLEQRT
jgi:hypothetical protein